MVSEFNHGSISRSIAESRLRDAGMVPGMYLLRSKKDGSIVLSYVEEDQFRHCLAAKKTNGFLIDDVLIENREDIVPHWKKMFGDRLRTPLGQGDTCLERMESTL